MLLPLSEAVFQKQVIEWAHWQKWLVFHVRPGLNRRGQWRTCVEGDGAGWPDLVLVRDRILFRELKSEDGAATPAQALWINALRHAGADAKLWRPSDWPEIEETLA